MADPASSSQEQEKRHRWGMALIAISALMFGSYGAWSRVLGPYFAVFFQSWSRSLIIFLLLLPFVLRRREVVRIARRDWGWMAVFLIFTSATQAPVYYAFNHMDIGTATLIFYVTTLLTMYIVGFLFLGEKLTRIKGISFCIACLGLYTVFSFSLAHFSLLAAGMAGLNGVASGGELSFSKKLSDRYSPLYLVELSWLAIVVTSLPLSLILGEAQIVPSLHISWLFLIGYAVASLLGFWLVIAGLKHVEASIGGLLGLLEIIFGIGFGILLFSESLTPRVLWGGVLIFCAAGLPHAMELWKRFRVSL